MPSAPGYESRIRHLSQPFSDKRTAAKVTPSHPARVMARRIVRDVGGRGLPFRLRHRQPRAACFCMSCGCAVVDLPDVRTQNPPGAKFCIECGDGLGAGGSGVVAPPGLGAPAAPDPRGGGAGTASAQRARCSAASSRGRHARLGLAGGRSAGGAPQAAVLFADLSGYTAVAERLDPEAVKSFVDRALRRLGQEVVRYGGTVDKYIGDNVMAVFGAPVAHEDDPERAVRAGLAMQAAMEEINTDIEAATGSRFSLRVGINSGEVLAGQVGDGYTVMGDAVNVAARSRRRQDPAASPSAGSPPSPAARSSTTSWSRSPQGQVEPVAAWRPSACWSPVRQPAGAHRGAADRPRGRVGAALVAVSRAGGPREPAAPGHGHRPGRGRQVAPAAWRRRRSAGDRKRPSGRALSRVRRRARLLGARRDPARPVRACRHRRLRAGMDEALRGVESVVSDAETDEPPERIAATIARPLGIEPPASSTRWRPASTSSTTPSRSATACSPLCARWSRR